MRPYDSTLIPRERQNVRCVDQAPRSACRQLSHTTRAFARSRSTRLLQVFHALNFTNHHPQELAEAESPDAVWKRVLELREQASAGSAPPVATPGGPFPVIQPDSDKGPPSAPEASEEGNIFPAAQPSGDGGPPSTPGANEEGGTPPAAQASGEEGPPPAPAAKAESGDQDRGDAAAHSTNMVNGVREQGDTPLWKSLAKLKVTKVAKFLHHLYVDCRPWSSKGRVRTWLGILIGSSLVKPVTVESWKMLKEWYTDICEWRLLLLVETL